MSGSAPQGFAAALPSDDAALLALAGSPGPPDPGRPLFGPGRWIRRVAEEPVLLFGGGRALLLEIAHPLVAAGVADHSNFRADPFGRLRRTLDALHAVVFGSRAEAVRAARDVERAHARVKGRLAVATARFPVGTSYSGRDPELVRWVWGTLVETAFVVYERFVAPLERDACEAFYADHRVVGRLFGVAPEQVPPDWQAFRRWFDETLESDVLEVTLQAREIGRAVFEPTAGTPQGNLARSITAALLPERFRQGFGLAWDASREARLETLVESVRRLRRSD
jgi:uncharacterized protein (DUF2236 family)